MVCPLDNWIVGFTFCLMGKQPKTFEDSCANSTCYIQALHQLQRLSSKLRKLLTESIFIAHVIVMNAIIL